MVSFYIWQGVLGHHLPADFQANSEYICLLGAEYDLYIMKNTTW